jgi:hypothetical protein
MLAIDVAVIGGTSHTSGYTALVNQLNDSTVFDFNATLLTESEVDTLAELSNYDVVVVGDSGNGGVDYSLFETALRQFVEGGGGVVSTGWILDSARSAANVDLAAVVPVTMGNYHFTAPGFFVGSDPSHPILSGISDFTASNLDGAVASVRPGSTLLASASFSLPVAYSAPAAVAAEIGSGKSVYLSPIYTAETIYGNSDLRSGMADQLLEQAVAWAAGDQAQSETPAPPTLSVALVAGQLTITDTTGASNQLTISNDGASAIVITDSSNGFVDTGSIPGATLSNGNKTLTIPLVSITGTEIVINGSDGDDTLTVDLTNDLGKIVTFNGGEPTTAPGDKLIVTGGSFASGALNHTNATDGSVVLGANTINYTGLEPVDITGTTITNLVINLPSLENDTRLSLTAGGTVLTVESLSGSHETDNIDLATIGSVTINGHSGSDTIRFDSTMSQFDKSLSINFGQGNDAIDTAALNDVTVQLTAVAAGTSGYDGTITTDALTVAFTGLESLAASETSSGDTLRGISTIPNLWYFDDGGGSYFRLSSDARRFTFSGMNVLQGGSRLDSFFVRNNTATPNLSLKGGGDEDWFYVEGNINRLDNITNPISIDGEAGAVGSLVISDYNSSAPRNFTIAENSVSFSTGGSVTFSNITRLTVNSSTGDNLFQVLAIPVVTQTILDGNGGTDTLDLTASGVNSVNITGGNPANGFDGNFSNVLFTRIENFLGLVTASLQASLDASGNLVIEDTSTDGADHSLTIRRVNNDIVITDAAEIFANPVGIPGAVLSDGGKTLTVPVASITGNKIIINGGDGADTLTADLTEDLDKVVDFNGGEPTTAPGDKLIVTGGSFASGALNHTNATDGSVVLGANTINYTGLEPVDITGTTITNLVINLPDDAVNPDDTELSLTGGGTILTVTSLNGSHELDNIALAAFTTVSVNARGGNDTIRLAASMEAFDKTLLLNGGAGDDTFVFAVSIAAPGTIAVHGGTGSDTLDYSSYQVAGVDTAVDVVLTPFDVNGFGGDVQVAGTTIATFTGIDGAKGNSNTTVDSLTGVNDTSTWTIDEPANNKYISTGTLTFSGFESLKGQSKDDTFTVTNAGAVSYTLDGGTGVDTFNLTGVTNAEVELTALNGDGFDGTETTKSITFKHINKLNGSAGVDSLKGINASSLWTIDEPASSTYQSTNTLEFTQFETLIGNADADTFTVTKLGNITTVDGGADTANDTLNLSGLAASNVELTAANGDGFDGKEINSSLNFKQINTINANGGATDSLKGINATATWTVDEPAGSKYASTNTLNFSKFEQLLGNDGDDTFNVNSLGAINLINGSAGIDTLSFTGIANTKVELTAAAADGFDGKETTTNLTFLQMNAVNGGAGANSLKGLDADSNWTVDESSPTASTYKTGANEISFSKFQTLTGQSKADRFNVKNSGATVYNINAGAGDNTLDYTGHATAVEFTLSKTSTNFDGTVKASVGGAVAVNFTNVTNFIGSSGAGDKLNGLNAASTWNIDSTPAANPTGASNTYTSSGKTARFDQIEILSGGTNNDTFTVLNNDTPHEYTLLGNGGTDKFVIGSTANSLTGLKKLNVDGGGNADDEITFNDQGTATDVDYELSATGFKASTGLEVTHTAIERFTLNVSAEKNAITVIDGAFSGPTTSIKIVDPPGKGASTLTVDDTADTVANTWIVNSSQVTRTGLTVDYSSQATITNLSLLGGQSKDDITITSTKSGVATLVDGGLENDKISVTPAGNLDALAGPLTVSGGGHNLTDTRTVIKGGSVNGFNFNPTAHSVAKGDTLIINDLAKAGLTKYEIDNTTVSRTTAAARTVNYSDFEYLKLQAGSADSDIVARMPHPTDPAQLPSVVVVDGGGNSLVYDNRFQIKGSLGDDEITIGDETTDASSRSQFEVVNVRRMWVEGRYGNDTIHNRTAEVPALLDGGEAKDATTNPALADSALTGEDDVIISDAQSPMSQLYLSSVLLGNDGKDFLLTRNNNTSNPVGQILPMWTTFLIGDYFINNNVPFINTTPNTPTSRLQVVTNPLIPDTPDNMNLRAGEAGDRYVTAHTANAPRNRVIARQDIASDTYGPGRFENMAVDLTNLTVIQWLQGKLNITLSPNGLADQLAFANFYIRQFIREPGTFFPNADVPLYPHQTYRPGGVAGTTPTAHNGGEAVEGSDPDYGALVQNPFDPADVNGDGQITAFDALLIINELNLKGAHQIDTSTVETNPNGTPKLLDVNGDSAVTAMDALAVINRLNMGDTTAQNQNALANYFLELDELERATNAAAAEELANLSNDSDDDALLALLAAYGDDSEDDLLGF